MLQQDEQRTHVGLRVLIADDHDLFRTGLRSLLEEQGVTIVGEAASGAEAVRLVRELTPEVVVMDIAFSSSRSPTRTATSSKRSSPARAVTSSRTRRSRS